MIIVNMSRTRKNNRSKKNIKKTLKQKGGDIDHDKGDKFIKGYINNIKDKVLNVTDVHLFFRYLLSIGYPFDKVTFQKYKYKNILDSLLFSVLSNYDSNINISVDNPRIYIYNNCTDLTSSYDFNILFFKDIIPIEQYNNLSDINGKSIQEGGTLFNNTNFTFTYEHNKCGDNKYNTTFNLFSIPQINEFMKTITIYTRNPNFEKYFNIKNNRTALIKPEYIPDQLFPFTEKFPYYKKYLEPNKIKYVLGPCSYTEFTYDGRNFYIFGETHNNDNFNNNSINCGQDMNKDNTVMFSILVRSLAKFYLDNNIDRTIDLNIEFGLLETVDKAGNNIFRKRFSQGELANSNSIQSILVEFDNFINTTKKYKHDDDLKQKLRLQLVDYRRTVIPNIDNQESGYDDIKKKNRHTCLFY